jgi:hypothetical protein
MLGAMLERAQTILIDGGALVVTFGDGDAGVQRLFAAEDNVHSIEQIATQTLGRPLALRVEVSTAAGEAAMTSLGRGAPDPKGAGSGAARPAAPDPEESRQALAERARKEPGVNRLLTEFGAQVVDVRPLRPGVDEAGSSFAIEENG